MNNSVSVLMTVYNGMPYLMAAIESILNQTYKDFIFLIIDDASTDDSVSVIESFNDPRIKLVRNEINLGTAKTINKGLSIIDSKYVIRLDQDDISLPNRIEQQIAFLEKFPNIDIACSWEHTIDHKGKILRSWKTKIRNYGEFLGPVLLGLCPIWHPSIAFKKNAMVEAGGFDAAYTRAEDFEVTARMAIKRYSAGVVPKFLLLQREHNKRQSREYEKIQKDVNRKIHINTLKYFVNHELIDDYCSFLRFESIDKEKRSKSYLLEYSNITLELFESVKLSKKLTIEEMKNLKKIFLRRYGYGILYCRFFSFLPKYIFNFLYNIISPLSNPIIRTPITKIYNTIQLNKIKFNLKIK